MKWSVKSSKTKAWSPFNQHSKCWRAHITEHFRASKQPEKFQLRQITRRRKNYSSPFKVNAIREMIIPRWRSFDNVAVISSKNGFDLFAENKIDCERRSILKKGRLRPFAAPCWCSSARIRLRSVRNRFGAAGDEMSETIP